MNEEQIKKEFSRWIDAGRPKVWYYDDVQKTWLFSPFPSWLLDIIYIVDDEQAELRKLQIDKPDTKFQIKSVQGIWTDTDDPKFNIENEYRIKPTEWYEDENMIGKPVWVRDEKDNFWNIDVFKGVKKESTFHKYICFNKNWEKAIPIKPEECYQGGNDD